MAGRVERECTQLAVCTVGVVPYTECTYLGSAREGQGGVPHPNTVGEELNTVGEELNTVGEELNNCLK